MPVIRPAWRNWQTRWTQNPVAARPCGFEPLRRQAVLTFPARGKVNWDPDEPTVASGAKGNDCGGGVFEQSARRQRQRSLSFNSRQEFFARKNKEAARNHS